MGNKLYAAGVVLFWLAAMSWLVTDRILPPMMGHVDRAAPLSRQTEPVAWRIEVDGVVYGEAVLRANDGEFGAREVHSVLRLSGMKPPKAAPIWLQPVLGSLGTLSVEMQTDTMFDRLERLSSFETRLRVNHLEAPISLSGRIRDDKVHLAVRVQDQTERFEHPWSGAAALAAELAPEPRVWPVYQGRKWRREVYSPLAQIGQPVELLDAQVTEKVRHQYDGQTLDAWVVTYTTLDKTGRTEEQRKRAELRVASDGRVLQQDALVFGSRLTLVRLPPTESARLATELLDREASGSEPVVDPVEVPVRQPRKKPAPEPERSAEPDTQRSAAE